MEHLLQTSLDRPKNGKPSRSNSADTAMAALTNFYAALDSMLFLLETSTGSRRDLERGVDFYSEVRSFEISLIKQALRKARGSQVRAASLLGMNATTLNSKIKTYSITYSKPNQVQKSEGGLRLAEE